MFKTAKNWLTRAASFVKDKALAVVGGAAAVVGGAVATAQDAMAALPASVGTTVTAIQADGQAMFDLVFPVIAAFVGLTVVITLFKRFTKKV